MRFGQWVSYTYVTKEDSCTYEFFDNMDDVWLVGEWLNDNGYVDTLPPPKATDIEKIKADKAELVMVVRSLVDWYGVRDSSNFDKLLPASMQNQKMKAAMDVITRMEILK